MTVAGISAQRALNMIRTAKEAKTALAYDGWRTNR
jgi:hypothetical protein